MFSHIFIRCFQLCVLKFFHFTWFLSIHSYSCHYYVILFIANFQNDAFLHLNPASVFSPFHSSLSFVRSEFFHFIFFAKFTTLPALSTSPHHTRCLSFNKFTPETFVRPLSVFCPTYLHYSVGVMSIHLLFLEIS